jgi:K+ transporter
LKIKTYDCKSDKRSGVIRVKFSLTIFFYWALLICHFSLYSSDHLPLYNIYIYNAEPLYWPMFVVAVMSAIIASQSLISASFSIIQQSLALGCFPRVKVVHTSSKYKGQVYVPEINTLLMLACVGVTLGFKNTLQIGNAYGKYLKPNIYRCIFLLKWDIKVRLINLECFWY